GLGLGVGLFKLFDAVGFTLPNNGLVLHTRTVIVALLVGILVTVLASLRPAARATRVPPISAVREGAELPPGRFARYRSVASALMIGLALVTLVAVVAAGITKSFRGADDDLWISGYAITAQNNFDPIPIAAGNAAARTPGLQAIANVRGGDALIFRKVHQATAVGPGGSQIFNMKWLDGGSSAVFTRLGAHGAFVDKGFAKSHHLTIGSPLKLTAPTGKSVDLHVIGVFKPPTGGSPFGPVT